MHGLVPSDRRLVQIPQRRQELRVEGCLHGRGVGVWELHLVPPEVHEAVREHFGEFAEECPHGTHRGRIVRV